jgi:hypothetical protein
MSFPMEVKNVDPLNGGLSKFYVIVPFTRRPSAVLSIQIVSDWNLAAARDIVACHLRKPPMYLSDLPLQYSVFCTNCIVKRRDKELHAVCVLYLPVIIFTICLVGIASSYGPDGTVFNSWQRQEILISSKPSRPAVGSTRPAVQWLLEFLSGVRRRRREGDHPPSFCGEV